MAGKLKKTKRMKWCKKNLCTQIHLKTDKRRAPLETAGKPYNTNPFYQAHKKQ
jgi:hypothetical protein